MSLDLHEFVPYPITVAEGPTHACKGGCACRVCSLQRGDRSAHYQTRDRRRPVSAESDRRQREHELNEALTAARALQARLELLGDRAADVAVVRSLRDSLARDMAATGSPA